MRTTVNLQTGEVTTRELTPEEMAALPEPQPPDYAAQIAELERQNMLPKAIRAMPLSKLLTTR